jgi:hypothetical protein
MKSAWHSKHLGTVRDQKLPLDVSWMEKNPLMGFLILDDSTQKKGHLNLTSEYIFK